MTMATTSTRQAAPHAKTCKEVETISYASESTHALLCAAIAIAERDANKTMNRPVGREQTYEASRTRKPKAFVAVPKKLAHGQNTYACIVTGDCLYPVHKSGETIICDPDAQVEVGDFVAIWWRDGADCPSVKRLVTPLLPRAWWHLKQGNARADLCVEQLNPPKRLVAPMLKVDAVHKVIHWLPAEVSAEASHA